MIQLGELIIEKKTSPQDLLDQCKATLEKAEEKLFETVNRLVDKFLEGDDISTVPDRLNFFRLMHNGFVYFEEGDTKNAVVTGLGLLVPGKLLIEILTNM